MLILNVDVKFPLISLTEQSLIPRVVVINYEKSYDEYDFHEYYKHSRQHFDSARDNFEHNDIHIWVW